MTTKTSAKAKHVETRIIPISRGIIGIGLYLILVTPLLAWDGFLMPFIVLKAVTFQVLVEIVSALVLITMLFRHPTKKRFELIGSPVFATMLLYLACSTISAMFGVDWIRSIWGPIERQDGLILVFHFFAWALAAAWYFKSAQVSSTSTDDARSSIHIQNSFRWYLLFSYCINLVVVFAAFRELQVGFDAIAHPIEKILLSNQRPGGVFGNPIMLGHYLLFHFFIGIYLFITAPRSSQRLFERQKQLHWTRKIVLVGTLIIAILGQTAIAVIIVAGQSRGIVAGLIAGLGCCILLGLLRVASRKHAMIAGIAIAGAIILGGIGFWRYRQNPFIDQIPILNRIAHMTVAEDSSVFGRASFWISGLRAAKDNPLSGWGVSNVYYGLDKYYNPEIIRDSPLLVDATETWFDKSHNAFIDILVERGVIGLILYCILLGAVFRSLWRSSDKQCGICMMGAIVACLSAIATSFDTFGSYFAFFFVLAYIGNYEKCENSWSQRLLDKLHFLKSGRSKNSSPSRNAIWGVAAVALSLAACLYVQVEIAYAQYGYVRARKFFAQDPAAGVAEYQRIFQLYSPYHTSEKINCAYSIVRAVTNKIKASQSIEAGPIISQLTQDIINEHPYDTKSYMALNQIFNVMAIYLNVGFTRDAETFGLQAIQLSPRRQEALYNLSRTYVIMNRPLKAIELNRRMLRDADFPLGHWGLGLSLLQNGQKEEALVEIKLAIKKGYAMSANEIGLLKPILGESVVENLISGK